MQLDFDDCDDFIRLHQGLMNFVSDRLRVFPELADRPNSYSILDPGERAEVHAAFSKKRVTLIDDYISENPDGLEPSELEEIRAWKAAVDGPFFVFRHLKRHTIFLSSDGPPAAYGVLGLTQPIDEVIGDHLPVIAWTVLLPFRGQIVYDGIMARQNVPYGAGAMLNDRYRKAKAKSGVVVSLTGPPARKKRENPKARVGKMVVGIRGKLAEIRQGKLEIKTFEDDILKVVEAWIGENLKREKEHAQKLADEVGDLEEALDRMRWAWEDGEFNSKAEAAEAVLEEVEKERESARQMEETMAKGEAGGSGADGEDKGETGGAGGEIPDEMIDLLFATFMRESRDIDVDDLSDEDYEKARDRFKDSFKHAAEGDRSAFEKALLETGADDSEENTGAVKKVFRRLARRLHPDQNPDFGEEAKELWEELGTAKQALDLRTLERLELHWQILQGDEISVGEEARLKDFQEHVNGRVAETRTLLRELKLHPLWGHEGVSIPRKFQNQLRQDIANDTRALKAEKKYIEEEIDYFRGKFRRRKHQATVGGGKGTRLKQAKKKVPKSKKRVPPQAKKKASKKKVAAKKKAAKKTEERDPNQQEFGF